MILKCDASKVKKDIWPQKHGQRSSLPSDLCFHGVHGKRHPKSAYGGSLHAITEQWARVLGELDQLNADYNWHGKESNYHKLLREYKDLLYRLNEHHDACLSVLRSLCPPGMGKPTTFDSVFLKSAKLPGAKHFLDFTQEY
jgi:hypothetical protein